MKIEDAIKYYISKSVNLEKDDLIKDFDIKKISNDTYSFIYTDDVLKKDFFKERLISGIISKYSVKIYFQKRICISEKQAISFTAFKKDKYSVTGDEVLYTNFYSTIKRINDSDEFTESIEKFQRYEFKDGNLDLLDNYENLISRKWPIIKNSDLFEGKKLVKKC